MNIRKKIIMALLLFFVIGNFCLASSPPCTLPGSSSYEALDCESSVNEYCNRGEGLIQRRTGTFDNSYNTISTAGSVLHSGMIYGQRSTAQASNWMFQTDRSHISRRVIRLE